MSEAMTFEMAKSIMVEAKTAWDKATTKAEAAEVIKNFGLKIGYKPLIHHLISGWDMDKALKVYNK